MGERRWEGGTSSRDNGTVAVRRPLRQSAQRTVNFKIIAADRCADHCWLLLFVSQPLLVALASAPRSLFSHPAFSLSVPACVVRDGRELASALRCAGGREQPAHRSSSGAVERQREQGHRGGPRGQPPNSTHSEGSTRNWDTPHATLASLSLLSPHLCPPCLCPGCQIERALCATPRSEHRCSGQFLSHRECVRLERSRPPCRAHPPSCHCVLLQLRGATFTLHTNFLSEGKCSIRMRTPRSLTLFMSNIATHQLQAAVHLLNAVAEAKTRR